METLACINQETSERIRLIRFQKVNVRQIHVKQMVIRFAPGATGNCGVIVQWGRYDLFARRLEPANLHRRSSRGGLWIDVTS
jgi:hypothetical protein